MAPHLCCSPDALVVESVNGMASYGLLECKCVYADSGDTWDDLIDGREHFCMERTNGQLQLRTNHPYYYQLIALMGVSDLPWIDLCVLKGDEVHIQRFQHDPAVWSTIRNKLTVFLLQYLYQRNFEQKLILCLLCVKPFS